VIFKLIDKEDAVQDVVLVCFNKLHRYHPAKGKRSEGLSLADVAQASGATVAVVRRVCGKLDAAVEAARRLQEQIARRIDAEPICWAEKVVRWVAETGQSGATLWRVLKRCGSSGSG
jgi:hypothetical protein